jgi:hypothetical protein
MEVTTKSRKAWVAPAVVTVELPAATSLLACTIPLVECPNGDCVNDPDTQC